MPGSNSRAMEKARGLACDTVILDLEDSVTPSAKDDARNRVVEAVSSGDWGGKEICVRINPLDTEWGAADLKAVNRANPHAVALPKVEHERHISELETVLGIGAQCNASIWAMIETPRGVLKCAHSRPQPRPAAFGRVPRAPLTPHPSPLDRSALPPSRPAPPASAASWQAPQTWPRYLRA